MNVGIEVEFYLFKSVLKYVKKVPIIDLSLYSMIYWNTKEEIMQGWKRKMDQNGKDPLLFYGSNRCCIISASRDCCFFTLFQYSSRTG